MQALINHLVSTGEERGWDVYANRLGGLEIYDEFEPAYALNRQVLRPGPPQNAICIARELAVGCALVAAVACEAAYVTVLAPAEHRRQPTGLGEVSDLCPMYHGHPIGED